MRRLVAVAMLAAVAFVACGSEPTAEQRARAIEARVWSPYCPGRLLVDCTTDQAAQLRREITRRTRAGQDDAAVLAWIRVNFGDEALAAPPSDARGLAVWLVPAAAVLAGAIVLGGLVRRWRSAAAPDEPTGRPPMTPAERERWVARVREAVEGDGDAEPLR